MSNQPIKADDHGITCHCRKCTDYWDQDHSKIEPMTTPTPAPSEGPYRVGYPAIGTDDNFMLLGPGMAEECESYDDAETKMTIANIAHSSALASREAKIPFSYTDPSFKVPDINDAVRELVKAARNALAWVNEVRYEAKAEDLDTDAGKALRTALAPFAGGGK